MPLFQRSIQGYLDEVLKTIDISDEALQRRVEEAAIKEMALYTGVSLIADLLVGCERQVYRNDELAKDGNWYTLNVSANPNQTAGEMLREWIFCYYYKGEAIMVPLSKGLYVADSYAVDEYPVKGNVYKSITIDTLQVKQTFRADRVYSIKQANPELRKLLDGVFAVYADLLDYCKSVAGQCGEKYELQIGALPSGDEEKHKQRMADIKESLSSFIKASSAVYPATKDQKLTRLSANQSGAAGDYVSVKKDVYNIVSAALHIPVGLLDGNITSIDQIINQTLTMAIDPLAKMISDELTRKMFTQDEIVRGGCRIIVDTSNIKHVDVIDMAANIDKLISSGTLSIDEVRSRCNLPEIGEDWSMRHYITKNYADIANPLEGGE